MINKKCMFRTEEGTNLIVHVKDKDAPPGTVLVSLYDSTTSEKRVFEVHKDMPEIALIIEGSGRSLDPVHVQALYESMLPRLGLGLDRKAAAASAKRDESNLRSLEQAQASYSAGDFGGAVRHAKESVGLSREGLGAAEAASEAAEAYRRAIGEAYKLMGDAWKKMGAEMRAVNCYTLALRAFPALATARDELQAPLQSKTWVRSQDPYGVADVEDIEDLLRRHTSLADAGQVMQFSCTQCGECCRSRDHISLSPLDVYSLSRADSLGQHQLVPTMRIYRHPVFSEALTFGRGADGYPTCQLRPRQSSTGACHFSYPLFSAAAAANGDGDGDDRQNLLSADEVEDYLCSSDERNQLAADYIDGGEEALQDLWEECEDDFDAKYADVSPVMNARGKQALGCRLGKADMPTLCASYPLVPEIEYAGGEGAAEADEGYRRELLDQLGTGMGNPSRGSSIFSSRSGSRSGSHSIKTEEAFVLVNAFGCEGFGEAGGGREGGVAGEGSEGQGEEDEDGFRPVHNTATSRKRQGGGAGKVGAVDDYLEERGLRHKWAETRWFETLRRDVAQYLPLAGPDGGAFRSNKAMHMHMQSHYAACVQRIWFDFDCLAKERRPIRSYARLKAEISSATWALARATKVFLSGLQAAGEGGAEGMAGEAAGGGDAAERYEDLVERLDILC